MCSVNVIEYTIIIGTRWYIEYYIELPSGVRQHKRIYAGANRIKDVAARERKYNELITQLAAGISINKNKSILLAKLDELRYSYRTKSYFSYSILFRKYPARKRIIAACYTSPMNKLKI